MITETEFVHVSERASEIGCAVPEIAILPHNFAAARVHKELRVSPEALAVRAVLEQSSFPLGTFSAEAERATYAEEDYAHWEASLFVSAAIVKREPYALPLALSIIRNHLADCLENHLERTIRFTIVVERNRNRECRKLTYEGDVAGLRGLAERVIAVAGE